MGRSRRLVVQMWEREWLRHPQAGNTCSTLFATPATSCLLQFSFQSLWKETQCSTFTQRTILSCLCTFVSTHVSDHAHKTKELKLKVCKDTAPSSHSDSNSEGHNKTMRNFSYQPILLQLPSLWSHHHSFFPTGSYMIPPPCCLAQVKAQRLFPMDKLILQFISSLKTHLWHQTHSLISFPALRTHLPSSSEVQSQSPAH